MGAPVGAIIGADSTIVSAGRHAGLAPLSSWKAVTRNERTVVQSLIWVAVYQVSSGPPAWINSR